jgi:hypothetical protein
MDGAFDRRLITGLLTRLSRGVSGCVVAEAADGSGGDGVIVEGRMSPA